MAEYAEGLAFTQTWNPAFAPLRDATSIGPPSHPDEGCAVLLADGSPVYHSDFQNGLFLTTDRLDWPSLSASEIRATNFQSFDSEGIEDDLILVHSDYDRITLVVSGTHGESTSIIQSGCLGPAIPTAFLTGRPALGHSAFGVGLSQDDGHRGTHDAVVRPLDEPVSFKRRITVRQEVLAEFCTHRQRQPFARFARGQDGEPPWLAVVSGRRAAGGGEDAVDHDPRDRIRQESADGTS
jgi:hypothetical protein